MISYIHIYHIVLQLHVVKKLQKIVDKIAPMG